jgi:hypothetical protein
MINTKDYWKITYSRDGRYSDITEYTGVRQLQGYKVKFSMSCEDDDWGNHPWVSNPTRLTHPDGSVNTVTGNLETITLALLSHTNQVN